MQASTPDGSMLTVQDNRTGRTYQLPIEEGSIRANDLRQVKVDPDDFGLMSYDPGFLNTASCRSAITYIDGDRGILLYRGYPIEELAGQVSFLDIAYLLIHGEMPSEAQAKEWAQVVARDSTVPEGIVRLIQSFPREGHPMAILLSAVGALGAYHPEAKDVENPQLRAQAATRLIGVVSTLAGLIYRHRTGRALETPAPTGDYARDFVANLWADGPDYVPPQALVDAIDVLFVLHADHEQNASTNAVRGVASTGIDPYSAIAAGVAALYGPAHGGANEAVLRMLREIATVEHAATFVERVRAGERRLMGFGHRVYKNYDPRARIIKQTAEQVFAVTGTNPLLEVALMLESAALNDSYFIDRRLYPNVDFYSGVIYEALGLPVEMFTVLFAVARTSGWVAQWLESMTDEEQKIARPRQIYIGPPRREFRPRRPAAVGSA